MREGLVMLDEVVKRAAVELRAKERAKDEVFSLSRRARMLSKQAILLSHGRSLVEAGAKLEEAKRLLGEVVPYLEEHGELRGFDEVQSAREEYAEASILHGLKMRGTFPKPEEIGVSLQIYLLGLGDVVGELRRGALDALRVGDLEAAESELGIMEHIYLSLLSMDETSLLMRGMRRKLDVARGVLERTRGELTAEAGRRRLSKALKHLAERLDENHS